MSGFETVYRVKDWDDLTFEQHDNKRVNGPMKWVAIPTKHDGKGYRKLMREPDGVTVYGIWIMIVAVAAKCPKRGLLADEDGPLSAEDISLKTDAPTELIELALETLTRIKWIESIDFTDSEREITSRSSGSSAGSRQPSAGSRQECGEMRSTGQDRTVQDITSPVLSDSQGGNAFGGHSASSQADSVFGKLRESDFSCMETMRRWFDWQVSHDSPAYPKATKEDWRTVQAIARQVQAEAKRTKVGMFAKMTGGGIAPKEKYYTEAK